MKTLFILISLSFSLMCFGQDSIPSFPFNGQKHFVLKNGIWKKVKTGYSKGLYPVGNILILEDMNIISIMYTLDDRLNAIDVNGKISDNIYTTKNGFVTIKKRKIVYIEDDRKTVFILVAK